MHELPVIQLESVLHIGTLDPARRGAQGESLEGHLLSVSLAPHAWRRIARLGGNPLHALSKPQGICLLDLHATEKDDQLRSLIEQWALQEGLLERKTLWRAWRYDSEEDAWGYTLHATEDEARAEVDEEEDEPSGPDDAPAVQPHELLAGTPALAALVKIVGLGQRDGFDYAAALWAERTQPEVDGVWWEEEYDPAGLSAPRGGLFPSRITELTATEIDWKDAPSDVESLNDLEHRGPATSRSLSL